MWFSKSRPAVEPNLNKPPLISLFWVGSCGFRFGLFQVALLVETRLNMVRSRLGRVYLGFGSNKFPPERRANSNQPD